MLLQRDLIIFIDPNQATRSTDPTNSQLRMVLTLVEDLEYATLGVLEILATDQSTVIDTLAITIGGNSESQNLYNGGDRYLCVFDPNQKYPDAVWLIGNGKNNYDFNQLYGGKGEIQTNVLMYGGTVPDRQGPNIKIGNGFMSAHPDSQITKERTGLGVDRFERTNRDMNIQKMGNVTTFLAGAENWYMDVVDITSNTQAGATISQGGLSNSEKAKERVRIFVNKLGGISLQQQKIYGIIIKIGIGETSLKEYRREYSSDGLNQGQEGNANNRSYGGGMSDIRLKTNITKVGETEYGIPLYEFNYKDMLGLDYTSKYRGIMAQDLLKTNMSKAVLLNNNGYYSVDYDQLSINLEKL